MSLPWLDKLRGMFLQSDGENVSNTGRVGRINFLNAIVSYNRATDTATVELGTNTVQKVGSIAGTVTTTSITPTLLFIASSPGLYRFSQILNLSNTSTDGDVDLAMLVNNVSKLTSHVEISGGSIFIDTDQLLIWLDTNDEVKYSVTLTGPVSLSCKWGVCAELLSAVP